MTQLSLATTSGDRALQGMGGVWGSVGRQSDVSVRLLNALLVVSAAASGLYQLIAPHATARRVPEKSPHACLHFVTEEAVHPHVHSLCQELLPADPQARGMPNRQTHPAIGWASRRTCDFVARPTNSNLFLLLLPSLPLRFRMYDFKVKRVRCWDGWEVGTVGLQGRGVRT